MKKTVFIIMLIISILLSSCAENQNIGESTTPSENNNSSTIVDESGISTPEETTEEVTISEGTTPAVTEDKPSGNVSFTMTQNSVINSEDYLNESKYSGYLSASSKKFIVPGLEQNTVPQGLAVSPTDGRIYISSYSGKSNTASVISVLSAKGELVAEYIIKNSNGTPFTGHVGGVAVTEKYLYFSADSSGGKYRIAEFKLSELQRYGTSEIKIKNTVAVPISPSYLFYSDGIMWVGNFYLKDSYPVGNIFNFTTLVDLKNYGGYVGAFLIDKDEARMKADSSVGYAKPDYVIATPDKVQGFAYKDGKIALSISYGRKNDSYIEIYEVDFKNFSKTVTADTVTYKFETLNILKRKKRYTVMPMTEGLALTSEGKLLVLFESAAEKYSDSRCPTDYIWQTDF